MKSEITIEPLRLKKLQKSSLVNELHPFYFRSRLYLPLNIFNLLNNYIISYSKKYRISLTYKIAQLLYLLDIYHRIKYSYIMCLSSNSILIFLVQHYFGFVSIGKMQQHYQDVFKSSRDFNKPFVDFNWNIKRQVLAYKILLINPMNCAMHGMDDLLCIWYV